MSTPAPATATVNPDSLPAVDLRFLSQSELHSLSKCSNSSFDLDRCHDVVIPKIDRSVFNESAGSRKQTYSRLRLAPADSSSATTIHRRTPRRRALASDVVNDPEQAENSQISSLLKELFKSDSSFDDLDTIDVENGAVANESNPNLPEPVNPNFLSTESPALVNSQVPALVNPKTTPELVNPTESPALANSQVPALVNPKTTPELVNPTEAPALVNPKTAPELVNPTEAPALVKVNPKTTPELVNPTEAPALVNSKTTPESVNTKTPELLNTEVPEMLDPGQPELLNTEAPELLKTETKRKRGRPRKNENAVNIRPPVAKRMRNSTVKKAVAYDDNIDREIVNCRGVEVDLTSLGRLEDPYGPEIRSRTEGLMTADELLGFLRGLNGQWGTTRKKRRVVDASEFGDFLPKGWRLSLCIKKKEGHVWLFCRRYISPSGRQFASCKDISTYLLSVFGEENMDTPIQTHNNRDDSALKGSSEYDASRYAQDNQERNITIDNPSTPPISLPNDCEKQITYGVVGPVGVHVDDVYKCLKCFLIFEGKSELSDHQSVSHIAEKSQLGSSLPDWSIVIGGIYNCNICHKTYYEINQYNEHIGTHVTNEDKNAEKTVEEPVSVSVETDHNTSFVSESKKIEEVVHDLDMNEDVLVEESCDGIGNKCVNDDNVPEADKASDVSVFSPECDLDQDMFGRSNGHDSGSETRVQSSSINDARVCNSFDKLTTEKGKVVYNETSSGFFNGISNDHEAVSETRVHSLTNCEEKGFREGINDMHMSNSFGEFTSEKGKVVNNESSPGVFHGVSGGQDVVPDNRVPALNICEEKGFRENINDAQIFGQFRELTSEKGKVVSKDSPSVVFNNRLVETKKLSESESLSLFPNRFKTVVDNSNLISSKKPESIQKLGFAPVNQVTHGFDENRYSYNVSSSKVGEQYEVRNSEFDRFGEKHVNKEYFHVDKSDEFQVFRNNESINNEAVSLGSSSQNGINANVMDYNTGKNIEFSSLVPPGNNQAYGFQDGLKFDDDIFGDKFDENIHGLSLAFGNPNSLYPDAANANANGQKKDSLDVQTDLRMVNNSMVQDLKRGNESRGFQNNDNSVYSGRTWVGDFKPDEGKKFMMASASNQMWKTPQGNQMQSGLVHPQAPIQSLNYHSFDIMSQKAQEGLFRPNERYIPSRPEPVEFSFLTDRTEHALQPGSRVFPYNYNPGMEQGFDSTYWMGKNNNNNNNMIPATNMSGRNVITSICAWCRNEFHLPAMAIHQQMQAGVGSLCPNCSAGISGQVNML